MSRYFIRIDEFPDPINAAIFSTSKVVSFYERNKKNKKIVCLQDVYKRQVKDRVENVKESVEEALEEAQDQIEEGAEDVKKAWDEACLLYTSHSKHIRPPD